MDRKVSIGHVDGTARTGQAVLVLVAQTDGISRDVLSDWTLETARVDQGGLIVHFAQADRVVLAAGIDRTDLIVQFAQTRTARTRWTLWIDRIPQTNENAQTDRTVQIG